MYRVPLLPKLVHRGLQFRLVIVVPPAHHLALRMIPQKTIRKSTLLQIVYYTCEHCDLPSAPVEGKKTCGFQAVQDSDD